MNNEDYEFTIKIQFKQLIELCNKISNTKNGPEEIYKYLKDNREKFEEQRRKLSFIKSDKDEPCPAFYKYDALIDFIDLMINDLFMII